MIKHLNINGNYVYNSIPLAFDESLSYLEELSAILEKLNETITQVNSNTYFIVHYEDEYDDLKRQIDEMIININTRFAEIEATLNEEFLALTNRVIALIDDNYNILKAYMDEKYDELNYKIDHISIDNIVLRDPSTGLYSNIQIVVNNLFNTFNVDAITAGEFDGIELSASEFDSKQITAYEFDTQSKLILIEE